MLHSFGEEDLEMSLSGSVNEYVQCPWGTVPAVIFMSLRDGCIFSNKSDIF